MENLLIYKGWGVLSVFALLFICEHLRPAIKAGTQPLERYLKFPEPGKAPRDNVINTVKYANKAAAISVQKKGASRSMPSVKEIYEIS